MKIPFRVPLVLVLLFALFCAAAEAAGMSRTDAEAMFREANGSYRRQDFKAAYQQYRSLTDGGIVSSHLYYNVGNAAARLGKTSEAVLFYEKARELSPRDANIEFNLGKVAPAENRSRAFVLLVPFSWALNELSLREWVGVFLVVFMAWGVVGALYFVWRKKPAARVALASVSIMLLIVGGFAAMRFYRAEFVQCSVVMKKDTAVFSGPGEGFASIARLREGVKVRSHGFSDPKWTLVTLNDGRQGYMLKSMLQPI